MPTKRITVSVPVDVAARIKRAAGQKRSVSEWVTNAVTRSLEEEELTQRFLAFCDAVKASPEAEEWARAAFCQITRSDSLGPRAALRPRKRGKTAA